jgi:2'-5' RNA ligase
MRLFTALDLPASVIRTLEELLDRLRPRAQISWVKPGNLHITLKFIGEWDDARLGELQDSLGEVPPRPAIPIHVHRVGFFPNPHSPRVFWCGIEAPGLAELAAEIDERTGRLGIEREKRAFSAHLTLARIKEQRAAIQPLRETIAALPSLDFGRFESSSFVLYRSKTGPGGSVYSKLAEFPLSK